MSGREQKRHHLRGRIRAPRRETPRRETSHDQSFHDEKDKGGRKTARKSDARKSRVFESGESGDRDPRAGAAGKRNSKGSNAPVPESGTTKRGNLARKAMSWTLLRAAEEFGVSRETIRRGLRMRGIEKTDGFTTREMFVAIAGDWDFEHTRRERAEADKAEVDAAVAKKTHVPYEDVAGFIRETFAPLREKIVAMPNRLAALCNPTDPEHARKHLESFRDEFLRHKEKLPPEPTKVAEESGPPGDRALTVK
jgi:hypothetical protein